MQNKLLTKGLTIGIILLFFGVSVVPIIKSDPITWDVGMSVHETGGSNDNVIFGESTNAYDGLPPDIHDVVKPPAPMPPYIRTWLNDNLPTPYDILWQDYRHYPSTSKVWNVTVQWMPSGSPSSTLVTISWSTAAVNQSEYFSVTLCSDTGTPLQNMRMINSYSFSCPPYVPQNFKIICLGNQPPNTPASPTGPTARIVGQYGKYFANDVDPDGDLVQFRFDWNASGSHKVSAWSSLVNSGGSVNKSHVWSLSGSYVVKVQARDEHGVVSIWSDGLTVTVQSNQPPGTPASPTGPAARIVGQGGKYFANVMDPDGDKVQYRFDWNATGSHKYSAWSSLVNSGDSVNKSHVWSLSGSYVVKVQARDEHGVVSTWSNGLTVTVQVNQPPNIPATPSGPTLRIIGQYGKYFASTTDPDGDLVQYRFDWNATGSHKYSAWSVLVNSGVSMNRTHAWSLSGSYVVKVQARDEHGLASGWSDGLTVVIHS